MRRLVAAGLLPERAGQPVRVWAHVTLAELRALDDGSVLAQEWIGEMAVRWAACRAAASQTGSDGAAWLNGKPARAIACDATVIPVVTGGIDPGALDDLVSLCLQFAGHGCHCLPQPDLTPPGLTEDSSSPPGQPEELVDHGLGSASGPSPADRAGLRPPTPEALEMLRHAIIGKAVDLVSGPGGLASFLRTRLLGARLAGPSLPLDVGHSAEIPAATRRAVILRDQHCRWAGSCRQVRGSLARFRGNAAVPVPPKVWAVTGWIMTRPGRLTDTGRASLEAILAASPELAVVTASVRAFAHLMTERRGRTLPEPWMAAALAADEPALRGLGH